MTPTQPTRTTHPHLVVFCLATLALAVAACGSANPSAGPSASVNSSSTGAEPSASLSASLSPAPIVSQAAPAASPAAANQPKTIHLIEHPTNVSKVSVGSLGCSEAGCRGDYLVGDDPIFDAATGKQVGTLMFECFLLDPDRGMYHCPGITLTLDGRGQIVFTEKFNTSSQTSPITGGTDEFLGATGTITSWLPASGNGDFVITINN